MLEYLLCRGFHQNKRGKNIIYIDDKEIKGTWYEGYILPKKSKNNVAYYIYPKDTKRKIIRKNIKL